jgi:RimJ/RimL family protein N-acetyltransferase
VILQTPRLRLQELTPEDLDFLAMMLGDHEVMHFYPKPLSHDEAREWLNRQLRRYAADGHSLWLVVDRKRRLPLGTVGLVSQEVDGAREPEIGWLIHRTYWRRGYATEAALGVRSYAFDELRKPRVISMIRPENFPSQGVARHIGMTRGRKTMFHGYEHFVFCLDRSQLND